MKVNPLIIALFGGNIKPPFWHKCVIHQTLVSVPLLMILLVGLGQLNCNEILSYRARENNENLNDLRATWDLLLLGYTSQAGSVAAAAFENALIVNCVAGDIDRAKRFLNYEPGGSPWSVAELCKIYSRQLIGRSKESGKPSVDPENETYWQVLYSQYMWLCKVKHPTIPSALHDAFSVSLDGDEYIIMAAPDTRVEDLANKTFILSVTILRIKEAIESFALARELDYGEATIVSWKKRLDSIITNLDRAVDPIMKIPLPFDYRGRAFRK